MIKKKLRNKIIIDYNDENEYIDWFETRGFETRAFETKLLENKLSENEILKSKQFETKLLESNFNNINCGCCEDCNCDIDICDNCNCDCKINSFNNDLTDFNITIIKNKKAGKKIGITIKLNFIMDNKINEYISMDFDINKSTYLKITNEL
jgi:hypothetical protein